VLDQGVSVTDREALEGISEEQSRRFLETMVACAPVGLGLVDLDLRFIHVNDTLAGFNGLPRQAHVGRRVRDVIPHLWPFIEPHYRHVMESGQPVLDLEVSGPLPGASGAERDFLVNYYPVRDGLGGLCGIGITVVETTETRRAHQALRLSEERYRSLVESMPQTVWLTNGRGEVLEAAPRWLAFTGQSHEAHLGLGWLDAIHPGDRTRFVTEWAVALETRKPYRGELRLRARDGRYRHVILRSVPVFDDAGRVREWISTAEDITEHQRAESELRRTSRALQAGEERYRTFVAQSTEGIWRLEVEPPIDTLLPPAEQARALLHAGRIAEANDRMAWMEGFASPEELVGTTLYQVIQRTTRNACHIQAGVEAFIRNQYRLENLETRQVDVNGVERIRLANLMGVVEDGRLVRVWGIQRDVTEQVHAKEALEDSREALRLREHQLRTITDALPALVAFVGADERYTFCNQAFRTWFGLDPEALVGQPVRGSAGELGYAHLRDWMRKALAGETVNYESALTLKDGRQLYVHSTYVPSRDARGNVQGFVALVHDITGRKRAEAEVEAQRARLYEVLMNAPASIAILSGPEQVFTLVNPIYRRLSSGLDLTGQSLPELSKRYGRWADAYAKTLRRAYESGKPLSLTELSAPLAVDGQEEREERFFNLVCQPLRDASGQVDSVLSFAMDVTEQVRARRRMEEVAAHLAHQQQWLESVLNRIPTAFLLMEPGSGRVLFANQAAHRMAGGHFPLDVPLEEYGDTYRFTDDRGGLLPHDRVPGVRAARGEQLRQAPVVWHTQTGTYALLTDSALLPRMHGHPDTVVLTLQDVTRLKQTEARLHEAVRLRDEFLTVASHELKTPLTPLQMRLQGLVREARSGLTADRLRESVVRAAESASSQVRKLTALINDLLDTTLLSGETLPLSREPVDLADVVRTVAEQFHSPAAQAGCALNLEVPGPVVGFWDRHRLEQVARGLLSNAIKYGPSRPVLLRLEPCASGYVRLTVRDEGIGIAPEHLPHIFEKFGRGVSARNYGGLGLGLFLTRRIVEAHGGTIRARSEPGQGAEFTVELPCTRVERPAEISLH
jgi:PAS domain S-box-containing protein